MDYSGIVERPVRLEAGDSIAPGTVFRGSFTALDVEGLETFSAVTFAGPCSVVSCPDFTGFSNDVTFENWVEVRMCPVFTRFPDAVAFPAAVSVINCAVFAAFPVSTTFASWRNVVGCPLYEADA